MNNLVRVDLENQQPNQWGENLLKVDATALYRQQSNGYLMIYNVNVPKHILDNQVQKTRVFERVKNLLRRDFGGTHLRIQVTASYILVNRETGDKRRWVGSFWPGGNQVAIVRDFQDFQPATFVTDSLEDSTNLEAKLTWFGASTVWAFHSIVSLIFNCQAPVPHNFEAIKRRSLHPNGNSRAHVTFNLD